MLAEWPFFLVVKETFDFSHENEILLIGILWGAASTKNDVRPFQIRCDFIAELPPKEARESG